MKPLLPLFLLILGHPPVFSQVQVDAEKTGIEVTVRRMRQDEQSFFEMEASGFARSPQKKVWQVLTDYERLQAFVPNLLSSKLLERNGAEALIEMKGRVGFFIMSRTIHLVLRVTEHPFSTLDVTLVAGDMKRYATRWVIAPSSHNGANGTHISYSGMLEPDFFVPSLLGAALLRADVTQMLEAVIAEIDKVP